MWLECGTFPGICQLVLMDADTSHRNVGGVFFTQTDNQFLKRRNSDY